MPMMAKKKYGKKEKDYFITKQKREKNSNIQISHSCWKIAYF